MASAGGRLLTTTAIAKQLGVPLFTVRQWLWSGRLPGYRAGGWDAGWRIQEADVDQFMANPANSAVGRKD